MGKKLCVTVIAIGVLAAIGASPVLAADGGVTWQPESPIYRLSYQWATILLLVLALGLFFGIGGRQWFNVYRSKIEPGQVLRHRALHAVLHWLNALGFILCLLSGAVLLKWIEGPNEMTTYTVHFIGAAFVLFSIGAVAIRALVYEPGKHSIRISSEDLKELYQEILGYLGLRGDKGFLGYSSLKWPGTHNQPTKANKRQPASHKKYTATERVLSYPLWAIISGVLIVTGIIKSLRYITGMPDSLLVLATTLHDLAAFGVIVMLILHVGAVTVIRTNWPLLKSMFTLTVPEKFDQKH